MGLRPAERRPTGAVFRQDLTERSLIGIQVNDLVRKIEEFVGNEMKRFSGGYGFLSGSKGVGVGIKRQSITDWFSGRQQPTAEQILEVQEFLAKRRRRRIIPRAEGLP